MPPAITVNYMVPIGGAGLSLSAIHQRQDEDEMTKAWRAALVTHFQVRASAQSSSYLTLLFQASNFFFMEIKWNKKRRRKKQLLFSNTSMRNTDSWLEVRS